MGATWDTPVVPVEATAVQKRLTGEVLDMLGAAEAVTLERTIHAIAQQHQVDGRGRCRVCAACRSSRWRWWRRRYRDTPAPCPTLRLAWLELADGLASRGGL